MVMVVDIVVMVLVMVKVMVAFSVAKVVIEVVVEDSSGDCGNGGKPTMIMATMVVLMVVSP